MQVSLAWCTICGEGVFLSLWGGEREGGGNFTPRVLLCCTMQALIKAWCIYLRGGGGGGDFTTRVLLSWCTIYGGTSVPGCSLHGVLFVGVLLALWGGERVS